jgi:hypothetical protein
MVVKAYILKISKKKNDIYYATQEGEGFEKVSYNNGFF